MTPEDLMIVQDSWGEFFEHCSPISAALASQFQAVAGSPSAAEQRADWLFSAVEQLVGLLSAPSSLAEAARAVGETWPDPQTTPTFAIEGRAWMTAAGTCLTTWSARTEAAWRQAWFLLSEVLAAETLSPFADRPPT